MPGFFNKKNRLFKSPKIPIILRVGSHKTVPNTMGRLFYANRGNANGADFWNFVKFILYQENRRFNIGNVCRIYVNRGTGRGIFMPNGYTSDAGAATINQCYKSISAASYWDGDEIKTCPAGSACGGGKCRMKVVGANGVLPHVHVRGVAPVPRSVTRAPSTR